MSGRVFLASAALLWSLYFVNSSLLQANEQLGESRTWKDSTGAYSVEARLIHLADDQVRLERADGSQFTVPLERLSDADRRYVYQESLNRAVQGVVRILTVDARTGAAGIGGGIVVDANGRVVTARHVVENASRAIVQFPGGAQVQVLGCRINDPGRDLALLELAEDARPDQFTVSTLGSNVELSQGMSVYAVGHPRQFENTVSKGVVGAIRETSELPMAIRMRLLSAEDTDWIQTDAVVLPGSSGGPLLDETGRVVGLVSWTADQGQLGFAVHGRHIAELIELADQAAELAQLPLPNSIVPDPTEPREAVVSKLVTEFERASEDFMVTLQRTPPGKQQELIRTQDPRLEYYQKFLDMAAANRGNRVGLQALIFAVRASGAQDGKAEQRMIKAMIPLVNHHGGDPALKGFAIDLINDPRKPARECLRRLAESSPSPAVKAFAAFGLVANLNQLPQLTAEQSTLLESHLDLLVKDFADFQYGAASFKELALPQLEYVRNFSVGRKPPDIVGKDIDGNELKLSDYLGKVIVLDFFGDFCVWCTSMYPYERQLVRELADQPFALLGVNGDPPERLREIIDEGKVTWPCWADGPGGPIATAWQVTTIPTIFVLDTEGVVRQKFSGSPGEALDMVIRSLLAEYKPSGELVSIDLSNEANRSFTASQGARNNTLEELPRGEQEFGGVDFTIGDELIQLGWKDGSDWPKSVDKIAVGQRFKALYAFHGTLFSLKDDVSDRVIGEYRLRYSDGSTASFPIEYGRHAVDWWATGTPSPLDEAALGWIGSNAATRANRRLLALHVARWDNPHPGKIVAAIDYVSALTSCGPFCAALTVEK